LSAVTEESVNGGTPVSFLLISFSVLFMAISFYSEDIAVRRDTNSTRHC
jgi:hypothetical protein